MPQRSTAAISQQSASPYKNYVSKLNHYLDKNDKLLQIELKNRNEEFLVRHSQLQEEKERALTDQMQSKMLQDRYKEMEHCSFKPMINKNSEKIAQKLRNPNYNTSDVDIPDEFLKGRNQSS